MSQTKAQLIAGASNQDVVFNQIAVSSIKNPSAGSAAITLDTSGNASVPSLVPPGTVQFYAANTAPAGWVKANGAAVSRTVYAALFAALGTTFGVGNGSTTFNLPDLRGEFPRGWDDGRGIDSGRAFGSAQAAAFASHNHGITDPGHVHTYARQDYGAGVTAGSSYTVGAPLSQGTGTAVTNITINNSGGTETRPRNIALLAIIKF
jgi:hypothetical protein